MRRSASLLVLALMACAHSEPGVSGPPDLELPFEPGVPLQLTWSQGSDRTPQWGLGPDRVLYAFDQDPVSGGFTGCVADLPAGGGSRGAELCETDVEFARNIMRPFWPTRRPDGTTAMIRQRWLAGNLAPFFSDLAITPPGEGQRSRTVIPIPYFSAGSGRSHQGISHLQWLDDDRLVFVGLGVIRSLNDNVESGYEILILDPADSLAGLSLVPGTNYASSVAVGASGDTIYHTLGGSSAVYRRVLSTGAVSTVFDFGGLGIARDVQVRHGILTAVVGGSVTFGPHPTLGMAQYDNGGPIYAVDLEFITPFPLTQAYERYRHPILSADGRYVVAEQFGDLWRIDLPF